MDFEQCGCVDGGNRRQYLVEARVNEDQLGEFFLRIVDLQSGGGGAGFDRVRIDGLCASMETRQVVFCVEDRDYETVREQFQDISLNATPVN